jgi:hypothetical protein
LVGVGVKSKSLGSSIRATDDMNRSRFLKFIEAVEGILEDNGISGKPAQDITLNLFTELNDSSDIRAEFKTKKDFIIAVNLDIKSRSVVKTRYQRDPVI